MPTSFRRSSAIRSLPLQMGVRVVAARAPLSDEVRSRLKLLGTATDPRARPSAYDAGLDADAAPFDSVPGTGFDRDPAASAIVPPPGRIDGTGAILVLDPAQNNTFKALNTAWQQGGSIRTDTAASGAIRFSIAGLAAGAQEHLVESLALRAERTAAARGEPVRRPRIAVYVPWTASMDAGWTRWVLERYGFPFVIVHPEDFKAGLADRADVLILADDARIPVAGLPADRGGRVAAPLRNEYAYQLTADDLSRLGQFVRGGGTIICSNNASTFAIQQLKLAVRNAAAGLPPEEFFLRGSIVQAIVDAKHPVMAGMPDLAAVFADSSPVFELLDGFTGSVLARYAESGSPLLSGYLIGEQHLHGKAAAVDVRLGAGHVVLLGFRPQWRGQSFGTFRVLFNAVIYAGMRTGDGQLGRVAQAAGAVP